jgi:gliding motility-associated lipoprotein GldD
MRKNRIACNLLSSLLLILVWITSCRNDYTPKPRGYFRISLPEKSFRALDSTLPYAFEYPAYSNLMEDYFAPEEPFWINIVFPDFKGVIHLTYKDVHNDLDDHLENARAFVMKHIPKANAIREELIVNENANVYGIKYSISGNDAASPIQFYVTDSLHHFLRGALYFNVEPGNDSLKPVIDFISSDIDHLIETLRWKQ